MPRTPHARPWRCLAAFGLLALAACGQSPAPGSAPGAAAPAPGLPGVAVAPVGDGERTWAGLLPCSDCPGVDTRLVLRTQGTRRDYLLTETYLGAPSEARFNRAGPWSETRLRIGDEEVVVFQLDPAEGGPRYRLQADGALELLGQDGRPAQDPLANRLQRL